MMLATMAFFINALLFFLVHPAVVFADQPRSGVCRNNKEEFGFALVGHDYKTLKTDNFGRCFFVCSSEETCQSATFLWISKECQLKKETKNSRPEDFVVNPAATYMENPFRAKKGSQDLVRGFSCHDILISGDSRGDGEYWIFPTATGDPFAVFCDMTTDGGGWVLISRNFVETLDSVQDARVESDYYKAILPKYGSNNHFLLREGFKQLKQDMGFTQIRFYCFKKARGRVFHIMTNKNTEGADVVKYFTTSDTFPKACNSFTSLHDDNSSLAKNCDKWGYPDLDRWGHSSHLTNIRLFARPFMLASTQFFRMRGQYLCDDTKANAPSVGDLWEIFVR